MVPVTLVMPEVPSSTSKFPVSSSAACRSSCPVMKTVSVKFTDDVPQSKRDSIWPVRRRGSRRQPKPPSQNLRFHRAPPRTRKAPALNLSSRPKLRLRPRPSSWAWAVSFAFTSTACPAKMEMSFATPGTQAQSHVLVSNQPPDWTEATGSPAALPFSGWAIKRWSKPSKVKEMRTSCGHIRP